MAITIRVPDPAEKYEVGNQRQIVRAINNVIQQLNAQYKPEGETFSEIEQLSYFLGYAPSTPSGPDAGASGGGNALSWQQVPFPYFPTIIVPGVANIGYIFNNAGFPDPTTLSLPAAPAAGTQIGALITSGSGSGGDFVSIGAPTDTIDGVPGPVQINFAGDKRVLVYDAVTSGWWTLIF